MMPAARIDEGDWQLESADILESLGFEAVPADQHQLVMRSWRGLNHRVDSTPYLSGDKPNSLDLLFFGMVQSHSTKVRITFVRFAAPRLLRTSSRLDVLS